MEREYFFVSKPSGEFQTDEAPISVNCAGITHRNKPFMTSHNRGRKDYTVYYIYKGALSLSLGNAPAARPGEGSLLFVPPETPFRYTNEGNEVLFYWVHFTGSHAKELWADLHFPAAGGYIPLPLSDLTKNAFLRFLEEMKNPPDLIARHRSAGALYLLLTDLRGAIQREKQSRRLERSFAYLQKNFTRTIRVEDLAKLEGLSVSRYHQLFRNQTGYTPNRYVTLLRINLARHHLAEDSRSVAEIAALCGYEDEFYFSRAFRRECGVSPSQYRKQKIQGV